jgi:hypothetical protein
MRLPIFSSNHPLRLSHLDLRCRPCIHSHYFVSIRIYNPTPLVLQLRTTLPKLIKLQPQLTRTQNKCILQTPHAILLIYSLVILTCKHCENIKVSSSSIRKGDATIEEEFCNLLLQPESIFGVELANRSRMKE